MKQFLLRAIHLFPIILGVLGILAGFEWPVTIPGAEYDIYAPIIALSAATMLILKGLKGGSYDWLEKFRNLIVFVFSAASAYLWMVAEAGVRSRNLEILLDFIVVLGLVFILAMILAAIVPHDRDNEK